MAKYKYEYRCPKCGTQLQLKMRVTQTKRRCPHCGTPVTPEEIDRQEEEKVQGCLILLGLPVAAAVIWVVWRYVILPVYEAIAARGTNFWVVLGGLILGAGVVWLGWVAIQAERKSSE